MKLNKKHIGKYMTRIGPCDLKNGNEDYSYIGDKLKILSIDNNCIKYATKDYNGSLDGRWLDYNWTEYKEIMDTTCLDNKELELLDKGLKELLKKEINNNFNYLNRITELGRKIENQIYC